MNEQDGAQRLLDIMAQYDSAIVAFSGGVDSTLVALAAYRALGPERMVAVMADSPSVAREELHQAKAVAAGAGFPMEVVGTQELDDPRYRVNDGQRCFFCKSELFATLTRLCQRKGFAVVMDGFNSDDVGDYRPGLAAGQKWQVVSPLKLAGLGKSAVRDIARQWGLPNWNKPASPCLASRIPYHTPVTVKSLSQVEAAEKALHGLGFSEVRVRHHPPVARIEVPIDRMEEIVRRRHEVAMAVKAAGYQFVSLDLTGLTTGSLNVLLTPSLSAPSSLES